MNKPELQKALDKHLAALSHLLLNVRDETGTCMLCRALRGAQHLLSCPAWPLISNRIDFHVAQEAPCPSTDLDDDAGAINITIGECK